MKLGILQVLLYAAFVICGLFIYAEAGTDSQQRWALVMVGLGVVGMAAAGWQIRWARHRK